MEAEEGAQYIKLISAEGHEFIMDKRIAVARSKTIKLTLEGSFKEAREGVIRFPELASYVLERVVKYLHFNDRHSNTTAQIPEFVSAHSIARKRYCTS